jgi:hypothetical protein
MALCANLLVARGKAVPAGLLYGLIGISLGLGLFVSLNNGMGMPLWLVRIITPLLLTLPLFFSGFAFATELKKASTVAGALAANLFGAMVGGFIEYNSMYFGFRILYILAMAMYLAAFFSLKNRTSLD